MSGRLTRAVRQDVIDGYMRETGANIFDPGSFIDWLADRPDHVAYRWFYAKDDGEAAREYRIGLARQMASGLRIVATVEAPTSKSVTVSVDRSFPAFVSPVEDRKGGGGYVRFDPDRPDAMRDLQRQAASSLRGWVERYGGAATAAGVDLSAIEEIVRLLQPDVVRPE